MSSQANPPSQQPEMCSPAATRPAPHPLRQGARSRRLISALLIICALQTLDLWLTQHQIQAGQFVEANVVAAAWVDEPGALAAYKLSLLGAGTFILYRLRRHWQAEAGAWLLLAASVGLMGWWAFYLGYQRRCLDAPTLAWSALAY